MTEDYSIAEKYKITWDGILRNMNKKEKYDRLKQYLKVFSGFLHEEIKAKNKNKVIPDNESFLIL